MKNGASTIKEAILQILSNEFPLTAKQLHFKIARLLDRTFSYQAFYKSLQELVKNGVVTNNHGLLLFSQNHVQNVLMYSEQLKEAYGTEKLLKKPDLDETLSVISVNKEPQSAFPSTTQPSPITSRAGVAA
jgi:hypothetical protein